MAEHEEYRLMKKRAVLYARVSTEEQAEKGYSLDSQLRECRRYAEASRFEVVAELQDHCSGTIPIAERPGGSRLYELVNSGAVDAVILFTHDRTARDEKVIEYLLFKAFLYDRGVELHYSDTGLDPYTMEGNLVGYIKAHAAADERRKILERGRRGKRAKAQSGKWMGTRPPYGYRKIGRGQDARLEIDEEEAAVVRRIYEMYVGRNGYEPHNILGIAVRLTAEKIPVSGRGRKNARGWTQETVRYILTNPAYVGEFRYEDIVMPFPHLAIIERELWEAAQERRKRNAMQARRNRKYDYLMAGGHIRCSCGHTMVGRSVWGSNKVYLYYMCSNQRRRYLYGCAEQHIRADIADALVWQWVHDLLADETNLEIGIRQMMEHNQMELTPKRERLQVILGLVNELQVQIRRLAAAYAEAENDVVAEALKAELKNAGRKLNTLREEHDRLQAEIEQERLKPEEIEAIKQMAEELREELERADFETKRRLLDLLDVRARVQHDETGKRWLEVTCEVAVKPAFLPIETGCSKPATTFAPSRSCSAIRTSKPL